MDIQSQSDGTVRLLTLIPAFYDAMFNEKTVFVILLTVRTDS